MNTQRESEVERLLKVALARETMDQKPASQSVNEANTSRAAAESDRPTKNSVAPKIQTILVPTDLSPRADAALAYARSFAERFGAKLILLHVTEPVTFAPPYCPVKSVEELRATRRKEAEETLGRLIAQNFSGEHAGSENCRAIVAEGGAATETDRIARECAADLIVITTHGYTGLNRLLLGSTAENIVRHTPCPVLVVRARENDSTA